MQRVPILEAARRAGVSFSTFRKHIYGQRPSALLIGFPAPCARGRRLLWLDVDIDRWLAAQSTFLQDADIPSGQQTQDVAVHTKAVVCASKKPGRPRKAVRP